MKKTACVLALAGSIFTIAASATLAGGVPSGGGWLNNGPEQGTIHFPSDK